MDKKIIAKELIAEAKKLMAANSGFFSRNAAYLSYVCCMLSYALSNSANIMFFLRLLSVGRSNIAHKAGVSVSELNPLRSVDAAMVSANCL